ncbi:MAG TPA: helix-turn-helix domain-containing protein [Steroidobacteraceae bacterium]
MLRNLFHKPAPALRRYVQFYTQREVRPSDPLFVQPIPARAAPILEFIYGDQFKVIYPGSPVERPTPATVIVGMLTRPLGKLQLQGDFQAFVIVFQPTGLDELFAVSLGELTDRDYDSRLVLGKPVVELQERLGDRDSFASRVSVVDAYLTRRIPFELRSDAITMATRLMSMSGGRLQIPALASMVGVGQRRLERGFASRFGVRPKLYARIVRFQAALDSKVKSATKSWTDVAYEFGYYDQMHLIHDLEEFTAGTPTENQRVMEAFFPRKQIHIVRAGRGARNPRVVPRFVM